MADEIGEIRLRIDIVELVGQRVNLKAAGKNYVGLCPFHTDKNPSFYVTPSIGRYKCFACGEGGDVFTWVMKTQNLEFRDALEYLAEKAGISLTGSKAPRDKTAQARWFAMMANALSFFQAELAKSGVARDYCRNRQLTTAILAEWEIGFAPEAGEALASALKRNEYPLAEAKSLFLVDQDAGGGYFDKFRGRLIFPIRDEKGDLVAFGGRLLGDGHPKYINSSDTPLYKKSRVLYGMNRAKDTMQKRKQAVLVEGYVDVIACHRSGVKQAIASLGTALSVEQAKLLKRWVSEVVILYDSDKAGVKATERAVEILQEEGLKCRVALMPEGQDPDTLLRSQGAEAVQKAVESAGAPVEFFADLLDQRTPEKDDAFWTQLVQLLAKTGNIVDLERLIEKFVGRYSGVNDQLYTRESLRRQVISAKKRGTVAVRPERAIEALIHSQLPVQEALVFGALLRDDHWEVAWHALSTGDLQLSSQGKALLDALMEVSGDGPPRVWISALDSELQDALMRFDLDLRLRVTSDSLTDTLASLARRKDERAVRELKNQSPQEESLREIHQRLKRLKGGDESS